VVALHPPRQGVCAFDLKLANPEISLEKILFGGLLTVRLLTKAPRVWYGAERGRQGAAHLPRTRGVDQPGRRQR
jgi:hypothetical protein